jgi:hypothetical protein
MEKASRLPVSRAAALHNLDTSVEGWKEALMRMVPRIFFGFAFVGGLFISANALGQDGYDVRPNTNFAAIRTYTFKETPPMDAEAAKTTTYDSPLMRERTNAAIAAQLEARGIKRDDANPDAYIVTRRTYKTEVYYYPYSWGWGYGYYYSGWGGWAGDVYTELRGTLTVDLVDARNGDLLWRGIETKHVHETSNPEHRDKRVADEVSDVFKHFPTMGAVATTGVVTTTAER